MSVQTQSSSDRAPSAQGASRRQRGWWIPYIFVGMFLVVVAVNGVMIYFAVSTNAGLETENHYVKGIRYNAALAGAREQQARGWHVALDFQSPEARKGRISLTLRDRDDNMLRDATATLRAVRPVAEGHDFDIELSSLGDGRFGADADFPLPGVWDLKLTVDHAAGDYQEIKRIWVQ